MSKYHSRHIGVDQYIADVPLKYVDGVVTWGIGSKNPLSASVKLPLSC